MYRELNILSINKKLFGYYKQLKRSLILLSIMHLMYLMKHCMFKVGFGMLLFKEYLKIIIKMFKKQFSILIVS